MKLEVGGEIRRQAPTASLSAIISFSSGYYVPPQARDLRAPYAARSLGCCSSLRISRLQLHVHIPRMRRPTALPYVILTFLSLADRLRLPVEKEVTGEPNFLPVDVRTVAMTVDHSERYGGMLIP